MSRPEVVGNLPAFVEKMQSEGLQDLVIDTFAYYYNQVVTGETGLVFDREIEPLEFRDTEDFNNVEFTALLDIEEYQGRQKNIIKRIV